MLSAALLLRHSSFELQELDELQEPQAGFADKPSAIHPKGRRSLVASFPSIQASCGLLLHLFRLD